MAERQTKIFQVSGLVQGVAYRANTQRQAIALGIVGWVRSLANGDVELLASGEPTALENLAEWLWQGPRYAHVDNVTVNAVFYDRDNVSDVGISAFEIRL